MSNTRVRRSAGLLAVGVDSYQVETGNGHGGTDTWNVNYKHYRACGTNGRGAPIMCTSWR